MFLIHKNHDNDNEKEREGLTTRLAAPVQGRGQCFEYRANWYVGLEMVIAPLDFGG